MRGSLCALSVVAGCTTVRSSEDVSFDGAGVALVSAVVDAGDFSYVAAGGAEIGVEATTWGRGSNEAVAAEREASVVWSAVVDGDVLLLDGVSPERSSGVDFDVLGPARMALDVVLDGGDAVVGNVEGVHSIVARSVRGDVVGDFVVYADDVDLAFLPYTVTDSLVESEGSVLLAVPWGLDYDLTVRTNATEVVTIADLGFQQVALGDGFFNGYTGSGAVEIDINAAGPVDVIELR